MPDYFAYLFVLAVIFMLCVIISDRDMTVKP